MIMYKYTISIDNVIRVVECPILNEKENKGKKMWDIQEDRLKKWVYEDELDTIKSNRIMYSLSGDKLKYFFDSVIEVCNKTIEDYYKKADATKQRLKEIMENNKI